MAADRMQFEFQMGAEPSQRRDDAPLRVLLLGDFSGQAATDRSPLAQRKPLRVDVDNLWKLMSALEPRCETALGELRFASLEDFHPDALFERLALFRELRAQRAAPAPSGDDSPLAALLGGAPASATHRPATAADGIEALIERVVAPHIVPDTSAQDRAWQRAIDAAISDQMRLLLHDPAFQSLEAAWRGLDWLVSNLDCDGLLQLFLFDIGRDELAADLAGRVADSALPAALSQAGPGAVLVTLFDFDGSDREVMQLASLGAVASQLGGPCIANARTTLWQSDAEETQAWTLLRGSAVAPWIGMMAPRLLMRRPYGKRSEAVDHFAFEEVDARPDHAQYLWAPGSLGFALLLGRSYLAEESWAFRLGDVRELDDLPMATREDRDGDAELVPCAETFLSDTEAEALEARGIMAWMSHRHQSAALLHRFVSITAGGAPLKGLPA